LTFSRSGAFVADLHGILVSGGIFFYSSDPDHPMGKLRLLYECAPLALLIKHAGGHASDGARRILDIEAHQRTPIAIGSAYDVASYERFFNKHSGA
jgi:fructose-1,6-bisphosphatase I